MTKDELKELVNAFKTITTADHFSIIIFCSLQQIGPFDEVLRSVTNISPETGNWVRTGSVLQTNQYATGMISCVEGLVFGYHDATQQVVTGKGKKAAWQICRRDLRNAFEYDGVGTANAVRPHKRCY